jgi:hypothetical protein
MASNREAQRGIGYPKLTAGQIDLIVDALLWQVRQRDLGGRLDLAEQTISRLSDFYTRRWGLPPAITGRVGHIRELAASMEHEPGG